MPARRRPPPPLVPGAPEESHAHPTAARQPRPDRDRCLDDRPDDERQGAGDLQPRGPVRRSEARFELGPRRGRLLWDECVAEERRRSVTAYFVPFVRASWRDGQPVKVFVRVSRYDADILGERATVEGLVQPTGLPFDIRGVLNQYGPDPAGDAIYIHHGADPHSQRKFAQVVLLIGFAGLGGFGLMCRFGGGDNPIASGASAPRRKVGEGQAPPTPDAEQRLLQQVQQRESEIDRWMRERGLKQDAPTPAPQPAATPD